MSFQILSRIYTVIKEIGKALFKIKPKENPQTIFLCKS